jgi:hypothetical protein
MIVQEARASFGKPYFMEVVITVCKQIWILRNGRNYNNEIPTFANWKGSFIHNISLLRYRIKDKHLDSFTKWISSLP